MRKNHQYSAHALLALCFVLLLVPMTAFAAPSFGGGTGTREDPWLIATREDLIALADFVNSGDAETFEAEAAGVGNCYGYYFKQTADIDLTGVAWESIGYYSDVDQRYFSGNYDGDGHWITNAVSTGKQDAEGFGSVGIFGYVFKGSVQNLHVKKADFSATGIHGRYSFVGGIAGVCYIASITNCSVVDSSVKSITEWQNNCAGSIAGYSAGGVFDRCAAEGNQVTSNRYSGGLVGELDDNNEGASQSVFSNCYVADCSVLSSAVKKGDFCFAGGFVGQGTSEVLNIQNCYVYRTEISTEGTDAKKQYTGVFAGYFYFEDIAEINSQNCYYGKCEEAKKVGTAVEKTEAEFADGTVAKLLGDAFAQLGDHPVINGPADYSAVNSAIAKANALNREEYKDFTAVENAVNAVVRGKMLSEQADVDAMAKRIEDAIAALEYKGADYTEVDKAIAKANALNREEYKDFTAVENAVNAVVRGKMLSEQADVDAMAKRIEDAIAALEYKGADYTKVDKAIAKAKALKKEDYKDFTAVENAVEAVVRGKNITEQTEVDQMAKAIEDAIAALEKKPASPEPEPSAPCPQTGDTSNLALWAALLLVSGGAAAVMTVLSRKKKDNR